jgi:hypothetical protein
VSIRVAGRGDAASVDLAWPGAGFDPSILERTQGDWHAAPDALPRELAVFARARAALPDLLLHGTPGRGVEVAFTLPRAGSRPPS